MITEHTWTYILLNVVRLVLWFTMVYPGECSTCTWEEYVFCYCLVECSINISLVHMIFKSSCCLVDLLPILHWNWDIKISSYCWIIYFSNSFHFCFFYWALLLGAYMFLTALFSWWIVPFIIIKCPLFLVTIFVLKFILTD